MFRSLHTTPHRHTPAPTFLLLLLLAGTFSLLTASCIREERLACPTWLTVRSDGEIHSGHSGNVSVSTFLAGTSVSLNKRDNVTLLDFKDGKYTISVPRQKLIVTSLGGRLQNVVLEKDTQAIIPLGTQMDSLCAFVREAPLTEIDEEYVVEGPLRKQFTTVTIRNSGSTECSLRVAGDWCGFSLLDLEPVSGAFIFDLSEDADGLYRVRVPRQGDNELKMEIYSGRRPGEAYGELLTSFSLGEMIEQTGFSWKEESLGDVNIDLNYANASITVYVNDWKEGRKFRFVI